MPNWFSGTALVAGSLAPDFEYFFNINLTGSHILDLFVFHLPATVFLSVIFVFTAAVLASHLPSPLDIKYSFLEKIRLSSLYRKRGLVFLFSSILGIISHLVLDETLHPTGIKFGISENWLNEVLLKGSLNIQRYILLERILSAFLLLVVLYFLVTVKNDQPAKSTISAKQKWWFWTTIFLSWLIFTFYKVETSDFSISLNSIAVTMTSAFLLSILLISVIFKIFFSRGKSFYRN